MINTKNVHYYAFGSGSLELLKDMITSKRKDQGYAIYFIDGFFSDKDLPRRIRIDKEDIVIFANTEDEPTTEYVDQLYNDVRNRQRELPCVVVGIGGGCTLDITKAVANLLTNGGKAEDYQGWDLVKVPGVYKIGIPTLSGTGAETSRTCVMSNKKKGLKLGMNSDFTLYDQLILDPDLTKTVPRDQYFFTGLDTYIHCIESLGGRYRHPVGDAFSEQAKRLSHEVFLNDEMQSDANRSKLMVASYLGGCALASSFVGVIHPLSAGLSMVLGIHHGVGNCIVMNVMHDFYPRETEEFHRMAEMQKVKVPGGICQDLTDGDFKRLYESTIIHEKPLSNALGEGFREILTEERVVEIFKRM
jgi:3-deoxy-alpha-D-manno-octulosonate 8-oxidase